MSMPTVPTTLRAGDATSNTYYTVSQMAKANGCSTSAIYMFLGREENAHLKLLAQSNQAGENLYPNEVLDAIKEGIKGRSRRNAASKPRKPRTAPTSGGFELKEGEGAVYVNLTATQHAKLRRVLEGRRINLSDALQQMIDHCLGQL